MRAPSLVITPTEIHMNRWRSRVVEPWARASEGGDFMLSTTRSSRVLPLGFSNGTMSPRGETHASQLNHCGISFHAEHHGRHLGATQA